MADRDDHHPNFLIPDVGHNAIVADTISPKTFEIAKQSVPKAARVFIRRNPLAQVSLNEPARFVTKFAKLARRVGIELNAPHRH